MDKDITFDYYYGDESEQFTFFRVPKLLITNARFTEMSNDAKLLYGLLLDRMSLSRKNGWIDRYNRVFINYKNQTIQEDLNCSGSKVVRLMKELVDYGLIEKERAGQGNADRIYVKNFVAKLENEAGNDRTDIQRKNYHNEITQFKTSQNEISQNETSQFETSQNEMCQNKTSQYETSQNEEIRDSKMISLDISKSDTNNNNINNTDFNHINPIHQSDRGNLNDHDVCDEMDEVTAYMEIIKENIEYDTNAKNADRVTKEYWEEIFNTICDVVCVKRKTIRVAGEDYPYELVKSRFLKLKYYHVTYVIECISKMTEKITNMKAYMITSLYNAPTTANMYLQNEVQNDLYGGGLHE